MPTARPLAAALSGRNATLRFLAENDVDPEPKDNSGRTPMDQAGANYRNAQIADS